MYGHILDSVGLFKQALAAEMENNKEEWGQDDPDHPFDIEMAFGVILSLTLNKCVEAMQATGEADDELAVGALGLIAAILHGFQAMPPRERVRLFVYHALGASLSRAEQEEWYVQNPAFIETQIGFLYAKLIEAGLYANAECGVLPMIATDGFAKSNGIFLQSENSVPDEGNEASNTEVDTEDSGSNDPSE